jgi:hypothetical protein
MVSSEWVSSSHQLKVWKSFKWVIVNCGISI